MRIRSIMACLTAFFAFVAGAEAADAPDFGPAVAISPPLAHPFYSDPDVALRDGRTVAAWTKARFGTRSWVQVAELDATGASGPVASIEATTDSGYEDDPVVALSGAGAAAIVWQGEGANVVGPPDAKLVALGADHVLGPSRTLGEGYDPVVRYRSAGDGLVAWSGTGGLSIAPIDPSGTVGVESTIPFDGGATRAFDPAIELAADGARIYWASQAGVLEARVNRLGDPESVATLLTPAPTDYAYRDLTVSGQLLVTLRERRRRVDLLCVPLAGGSPVTIGSGSVSRADQIRFGSVDVDEAGADGLVGWVERSAAARPWKARVATVDDRCHVSRTSILPSPGRRAYDIQVGHDGASPLALVAGGGGLEAVGLSRSGGVRGSRRIANTRPFSKKLESRTPVKHLELRTEPGSRPTAVWAQSHRGPGQTIAASVAP